MHEAVGFNGLDRHRSPLVDHREVRGLDYQEIRQIFVACRFASGQLQRACDSRISGRFVIYSCFDAGSSSVSDRALSMLAIDRRDDSARDGARWRAVVGNQCISAWARREQKHDKSVIAHCGVMQATLSGAQDLQCLCSSRSCGDARDEHCRNRHHAVSIRHRQFTRRLAYLAGTEENTCLLCRRPMRNCLKRMVKCVRYRKPVQ